MYREKLINELKELKEQAFVKRNPNDWNKGFCTGLDFAITKVKNIDALHSVNKRYLIVFKGLNNNRVCSCLANSEKEGFKKAFSVIQDEEISLLFKVENSGNSC